MKKFYADGGAVYKKPVTNKKAKTVSMGFKFCVCEHYMYDNGRAKEVAAVLNGTKAKKIIRALLKHFPKGSKAEERALKDILRAEQFLKDGPI